MVILTTISRVFALFAIIMMECFKSLATGHGRVMIAYSGRVLLWVVRVPGLCLPFGNCRPCSEVSILLCWSAEQLELCIVHRKVLGRRLTKDSAQGATALAQLIFPSFRIRKTYTIECGSTLVELGNALAIRFDSRVGTGQYGYVCCSDLILSCPFLHIQGPLLAVQQDLVNLPKQSPPYLSMQHSI